MTSLREDFQKRFCFEYKFFNLTFGCPDYSDVTPGEMPCISCFKSHFFESGDDNDMNLPIFRRLIRTARECEDFQPLEEE